MPTLLLSLLSRAWPFLVVAAASASATWHLAQLSADARVARADKQVADISAAQLAAVAAVTNASATQASAVNAMLQQINAAHAAQLRGYDARLASTPGAVPCTLSQPAFDTLRQLDASATSP